MRVLLLSPPFVPEYMRNARCDYVSITHAQWYPIWLSYCGALLEKHGHKVELIDAPAEGLGHEETLGKVLEFKPDLAVVYSSTKSEENDIQFTGKVKEGTGCSTAFVGPFVSVNPRGIITKSGGPDYAVKGEFEYPILELAEGKEEKGIRNLIFREGDGIRENERRPLLNTAELDALPFVTDFYRRHLRLENYNIPQQHFPFVDLFTGRGCNWGHCTFCLWVHSFIPGGSYNVRSVQNVVEELLFIQEKMRGVKEVVLQDDMLPKWRATELSQAMREAGFELPWSCYVKGDMEYETLKLMGEAGCRMLHVGYESGDAAILKNIKKGLSPSIMERFTLDANRAGLKVHGDFLIGLPGETEETIVKTINWAKGLGIDTAQFSLINPYPGTPFYEYLSLNNYLKDGEPSYPHLSNEELRSWARRGVRDFYLSFSFTKKVLRDPHEYLISHLRSYRSILPRMLWRRW